MHANIKLKKPSIITTQKENKAFQSFQLVQKLKKPRKTRRKGEGKKKGHNFFRKRKKKKRNTHFFIREMKVPFTSNQQNTQTVNSKSSLNLNNNNNNNNVRYEPKSVLEPRRSSSPVTDQKPVSGNEISGAAVSGTSRQLSWKIMCC